MPLSSDGSEPRVAVDEAGAGHIVWQERTSDGGEMTKYCRLPQGATACAATHVFQEIRGTKSGVSFPPSWVLAPGGGRIIVLVHMCCDSRYGEGGDGRTSGLFAFVSDDGGVTFGPARLIGNWEPSGDAIALSRDVIAVVSDAVTGGTLTQVASVNSYTSARAKVGEGRQAYGGSLAASGGALVVSFNDLESTFLRGWPGAGDANDVASWSPAAPVGSTTSVRLAGSPHGIYVLRALTTSTGEVLQVAALTGAGLVPRAVAARGRSGDFFADASGRLHLVWTSSSANGRWFYRRSSNATAWSPVAVLDQRISVLPAAVHADANAAGRGWAVTGPRQIVAAPLPRVPRAPRERVCRKGVCLVARDKIADAGCLDPYGTWRFEVKRASKKGPRVRSIRWTTTGIWFDDGRSPFRLELKGLPGPGGSATLRVRAKTSQGPPVRLKLRFQRCPS